MVKKQSDAAATSPNNGVPSTSTLYPQPSTLSAGGPAGQVPKKKKPKAPKPASDSPPAAPGQTSQDPTTAAPQKKKVKKAKQAAASASVPAVKPATIQQVSPTPPPVYTPADPRATSFPDTAPQKPRKKFSEFALLDGQVNEDTASHQTVTAPLITRDAFAFGDGLVEAVPQYGILGSIVSIHSQGMIEGHKDKRVYLNTNAPFSAVVCGVQGSGKSHTVGVLLESMLIANDTRLGILPKPLTALVLHFGESGAGAQPCEAAHQCLTTDPDIKPPAITVFVSPTQFNTMKNLYKSSFGNKVQVLPLKITHAELDSKSILSMMSVSTNTEPPLYVQIILNILRELGETFTYTRFKLKLEEKAKTFNPAQKAMCDQRLSLLESFLEHDGGRPRFRAGEVTIVDLTDPFIDAAGACSLFEIITRLFIRADVGTGKVLVVDEAHKYLTRDQGSEVLTQTLLSIVRQQRHLGTRLILSTQEPTVVPEALLDLCSVTIMHRFSSITWFNHLAKHVSSDFGDEAFDAVVQLETGQALVLAPAGLGVFQKPGMDKPERGIFGRRYLIVKTRRRLTADGGASILAV